MAEQKVMDVQTVNWPVQHGIVWLRDPSLEDLPYVNGVGAVWATAGCVVVGCLGDSEGDTFIKLGAAVEVGLEAEPLFDSVLQTPSNKIVIETSEAETIFESPASGRETRVRVWTDGHPASAFVVIGLG